MIILLLFSNTIFNFFENHIHNPNSLKWAKSNIWFNCLLWAIGILIHGFLTFKYKISFVDKWEKKKIDELMNEKK